MFDLRARSYASIRVAVAVLLLAGNLFSADEPANLQRARQEFERATDHSEEARSRYITRLTRVREKSARSGTKDWKAVDAEIMRHPAGTDLEKAFAKLLEGKWRSPRHDYLYRPDGTWTMLPIETDGTGSTHGTWRVEGHECFETTGKPATTSRYTILLLTNKDFAFTDGQVVFYRTRFSN